MNEIEQLIRKFWDNQTTEAENRRLYEMLPDQQKEMSIEQWKDDFVAATGRNEQVPDSYISKRLLSNIHQQIASKRSETKIVSFSGIMKRVAVAAGIIILAGAGWLSFRLHGPQPVVVTNKTPFIAPRLVEEDNNADTIRMVVLTDGSQVTLQPHSAITYQHPFTGNRRDIHLTGTGFFKVAKDKSRPFTVYAGGIGTTALGTQFWVNAADRHKVIVKLLEGKVVIRATANDGIALQDVFLEAGQTFSLNKHNGGFSVASSNNKAHRRIPSPSIAANRTGIAFDREPLDKVFIKISQVYKVPLSYEKRELDGLYFTGTFLPTDDLQMILSSICNVNDLRFNNGPDGIVITKPY